MSRARPPAHRAASRRGPRPAPQRGVRPANWVCGANLTFAIHFFRPLRPMITAFTRAGGTRGHSRPRDQDRRRTRGRDRPRRRLRLPGRRRRARGCGVHPAARAAREPAAAASGPGSRPTWSSPRSSWACWRGRVRPELLAGVPGHLDRHRARWHQPGPAVPGGPAVRGAADGAEPARLRLLGQRAAGGAELDHGRDRLVRGEQRQRDVRAEHADRAGRSGPAWSSWCWCRWWSRSSATTWCSTSSGTRSRC